MVGGPLSGSGRGEDVMTPVPDSPEEYDLDLPSLHDSPSMAQLIEAVRDWMERDVLTNTSGRVQFHTRVAINVLSIVERELALGSDQRRRHAERLAGLGFESDAELAAAIRRGDLDTRIDAVVAAVRAAVVDKLRVANPGYFAPGEE